MVVEQANLELVQRAYQTVATGRIAEFLNLLASDVVWELPEMPNVVFAGTWRGREGVGEFFRRLSAVQDIIELQPDEFVVKGEKVIVLGRFRMHVKATGKESRSAWVHVWKLEDGQVKHMREYVDSLAVSQAHQRE